MSTEIIKQSADEVIKWASLFASHQTADGSIQVGSEAMADARLALGQTIESYGVLCYTLGGLAIHNFKCLQNDAEDWLATGLDSKPNFSSTHGQWKAPQNREIAPFLGPIRIPNGIRGGSFVLNFALLKQSVASEKTVVNETTAADNIHFENDIPTLDAPYRSQGYSGGDGSVLFSELLAAHDRHGPQTFGAFILTDFPTRYNKMTLHAPTKLSPSLAALLQQPNIDAAKQERATWLQIHDRFHEVGMLPHSEHIASKMFFPTATMDELKADGSAYLALRKVGDGWSDAACRQLIDKMFRFPFSAYAYSSVDGAVGELFIQEAIDANALRQDSNNSLVLNLGLLDVCIENLVANAKEVETNNLNLEAYKAAATEYLATKNILFPPHRKPLNWALLFH